MNKYAPILILMLMCTTFNSTASLSSAEVRRALVIGNANYQFAPLANPINDAKAMTRKLKGLDFEVTTLLDVSLTEIESQVADFFHRSNENSVNLIYYAGHAVQYKQQNFLLPIENKIHHKAEILSKAYNLNLLLAETSKSKSQLNFIILDACRTNPYSEQNFSATGRSLEKVDRGLFRLDDGLAQIKGPSGTYIAFATEPGKPAEDGSGENGTYTKHLLKHIDTPQLSVEDMFKKVRLGVINETNLNQIPWEHSSLTGEFYFVSPTMEAKERDAWQAVRSSESIKALKDFIEAYPNGVYSESARKQLQSLKDKEYKNARHQTYPSF